MTERSRHALGLLAFLGLCLGASVAGGLFTASSVDSWYRDLAKPSWNPPDWVFAPVWTTLYLAMGFAAWLVWRHTGDQGRERRLGLRLFALQLGLNVLWSALFFGLRNPAAGLVEILLLLATIAATTLVFARVSKTAALVFLPYLVWVTYATSLNAALWWLH